MRGRPGRGCPYSPPEYTATREHACASATLIETRRAIKQFDPKHTLSPAEQDRLIELAVQSPTAFNLQHWPFVVVRDEAQRQAIREVAWDQSQVTDASMLVILCGRLDVWENEPKRVWRDAPEAAQEMMIGAIDAYYRDLPQVQRDEVMRTCGIAGQTLMLAARKGNTGRMPCRSGQTSRS